MSTSPGALPVSTLCDRCQAFLMAPEWSESLNERETVHLWFCPVCGNEFQTVDNRAEPVFTEAELAQEFLPNLMVA
jgi:hypothetical protein